MLDFINEHIALCCLPLIVFIIGGYLAIKMRIFTPKCFKCALSSLFSKNERDGISPVSALCTALAGTLGVGNIAGVAVAISLGGPGAVFWMWVSALFSLSLKYTETVLAVKYRKIEGTDICGGPMYYIFYGLGNKRLANIFCILCITSSLCSGCIIQSNSASVAMYRSFGIPHAITGLFLGILCGVIVLGGIKSISRFTSIVIPITSAVFFALSLIAVCMSIDKLPYILSMIFKNAFGIQQISSGICGFSVRYAIKHGVVKSSLSHEAGSGTSTISHAASNTKSPVEQGFLGIFEVIADTLIMCTVTALVILCAYPQVSFAGSYSGVDITSGAYGEFFGVHGETIISSAVLLFAFATVICQSYYGVSCVGFLTKNKNWHTFYVLAYCVCTVLGSVITFEFMWRLTDLFTCCMIFLNVYAILRLSGEAEYETVKYYSKINQRCKLR